MSKLRLEEKDLIIGRWVEKSGERRRLRRIAAELDAVSQERKQKLLSSRTVVQTIKA